MRIIKVILFSIVACSSSQAQLEEGYFQFDIDVQAIDTTADIVQQASLLRGSRMELYFAPGLYRMDYYLGMVSMTSIRVDTFKNEVLSLTKGVMGNYAYKNTPDAVGFGQQQIDSAFNVQLFNEERVFLGFKCKKAVLEKNGVRATYWYTTEIELPKQDIQMINKDIPGFPLAFTMIDNGIRIHYQVSNYAFEVENKTEIFNTNPPPEYKIFQQ